MSMVVCTGHPPQSLGGFDQKKKFTAIKEEARCKLEKLDPDLVITGMALGWDQWIAEVCIDLKILFIAALPFKGRECRWSSKSQQHYLWLLSKAARIVHVDCEENYKHRTVASGVYHPAKMFRRNEWMIDQMLEYDTLLSLWNGKVKTGTYNCIQYFRSSGPVNTTHIQINPRSFDDLPF